MSAVKYLRFFALEMQEMFRIKKIVSRLWRIRRHRLIYPIASRVRLLLSPLYFSLKSPPVLAPKELGDQEQSSGSPIPSASSTFNRLDDAYGGGDPVGSIGKALDSNDPIQAMAVLLAYRSRLAESAPTIPRIVHALRGSAKLRWARDGFDDVERLSAIRACELLLRSEIEFEAAKNLIWKISYQGDFSPDSRAWVQNVLKQAARKTLLEKTRIGLALHFLVANKGFNEIPEIVNPEFICSYESSDLAHFLFAVALYGDRAQKYELNTAVMSRVRGFTGEETDDNSGKTLALLSSRLSHSPNDFEPISHSSPEALRRQNSGNQSKKKIFVGFFGQIRYEDYFYGSILPSFRQALAEYGFEPQFACATWDKTGKQELFDWSGLDFVHARLPSELAPVLAAPDIINLTDFGKYFPATASVIRRHNSGSGRLNIELLKSNLGGDPMLDFSTEMKFQKHLIASQISRFDIEEPRMNQVRMFDRLNALGRLAEQYKATSQDAGPYYLFMRPDVEFPLGRLLGELTSGSNDRTLIVDHDDQAEFIGGIGDRYFAGGFTGIQAVAGTLGYLSDLARRDDWEVHRNDIHAHRFIAQQLFRSGVNVRSLLAADVPLRLHRGSIPRTEIMRALESDSRSSLLMATPELHRKLQGFLENERQIATAS